MIPPERKKNYLRIEVCRTCARREAHPLSLVSGKIRIGAEHITSRYYTYYDY